MLVAHLACCDCLDWMREQPDDCCDLVFGSPPYESARSYGIGFKLTGQAWVDWMVERMAEMARVCRGMVALVVEGQTKNFRWSATPALLMADLHRGGWFLRKPPIFQRVGIPGSGGPDWLRNDYESIVCITSRPGKLPWSDNTAMGHPPKWAPGGEMSNRLSNGERRNQWGGTDNRTSANGRYANGEHKPRKVTTKFREGMHNQDQSYQPPAIANPGNVIRCNVGGNLMGSPLAHENEAPFPESLAELFVRSFCPPGGTVLDPFCGSGTTGAAAIKHGRKFVGLDIRESQIELTERRLAEARAAI